MIDACQVVEEINKPSENMREKSKSEAAFGENSELIIFLPK